MAGFGSLILPKWTFDFPDGTVRTPVSSDFCRCGHTYDVHPASTAQRCMDPGCQCGGFVFRYGPTQTRLEAAMKEIYALSKAKVGQDVTMTDIEKILMKALEKDGAWAFREPQEPAPGGRAADGLADYQRQQQGASAMKPPEPPKPIEGRAKRATDEEEV